MIGHRLNEELTLSRASYVSDGRGGRTQTWADVGTVRAQVSQPSTDERLAFAQLGATLTHVVHAAYGTDVQRGDRLTRDTGAVLRVTGVSFNSRRSYLRLDCEAVQSE